MKISIETPRLKLKPCYLNNLEAVYTLWTNDRIRYFLFDDRVISSDEACSFIQDSLTNFERHGYGLWLIYLRKNHSFIGFAGCLKSENETPGLIYGIHPDYWNEGYATEAASTILRYISSLGFPRIAADVDEPNVASIQVLKNLGMRQKNQAVINQNLLLYFEYLR
jgi:[ribosomal protein S5]-alanine N-acetyltransferase